MTVALACCRTPLPVKARGDAAGLLNQRRLIEQTFAGTDVRADTKALADFRSGGRDSVSAAWFGFDPNDATASLQESLDSGARVVLVPAMGSPWITRPLLMNSRTTLVLQEGAEIIAKRGSFRGTSDSLLGMKNLEDVTICGYGARLVMRKSDYRMPPYSWSEWRHAIELYGCSRVSLLGLSAASSGGDGIYIGSGERGPSRDIVLEDLVLRDHYRQGISVISVEGLRVENVEIDGTGGTLPMAGIDFEPNYPGEELVDCVLKNCVIDANGGAGISVILGKYNSTSPAVAIRVEDSFIANNTFSLFVWGARAARGQIDFVNTRLQGLRIIQPGSGVEISGL